MSLSISQQPGFPVASFMGFSIGTGSLPPGGVKCASELEDIIKIGIAEASLGQRGFWESCLLSCKLGQFGPVKWKINKSEKKGIWFETKCSLQPGCCQACKYCSCEALKNPILEIFSSRFNRHFSCTDQMPGTLPRTGNKKMEGWDSCPQGTHSLVWLSSDGILHWGKYSSF